LSNLYWLDSPSTYDVARFNMNGHRKQNGSTTTRGTLGQSFTQQVKNATGPQATPRARKVVGSLIQHLHDFIRENEVTVDEFMAGLDLVRPVTLIDLDEYHLTRRQLDQSCWAYVR
jgi:hypothetical protein